jgi:hypothetical protein
MGTATVVALSARPWKTSILSFEISGILAQLGLPSATSPTQLGDSVTPFIFTTFYAGLGAAPGDGSLLTYNSDGILSAPVVMTSALASLRAEPRAAALDRAVCLRQNAFYSRYSPTAISNIVSAAQSSYGTATTAKPALLTDLSNLAQQQANELSTAYTADGRTGVVKNTSSSLNSKTTTTDSSSGSAQSSGKTTPDLTTKSTGESNLESVGGQYFSSATLASGGFPGPPPAGGAPLGEGISTTSGSPSVGVSLQDGTSGETATETGTSTDTESGTQTSTGSAYAVETQTIVNTDYGYRVPSIESQAQNARAQISLLDQQYGLLLASQSLTQMSTVMQNELSALDLGVYQLQVGFLNSILMSPIAGVVTGIYKMPGDAVRAGDPVIRVDDNTTLYLLATVVYRGPIVIAPPGEPVPPNSTVTINTSLFDAAPLVPALVGTVVALRCRGDDDVWDLVVQCPNPSNTLPIGYVFDYDNTTMTIK